MTQDSNPPGGGALARKTMMGVLARASHQDLVAALARLEPLPDCEDLRAPDTGLVMLRGRMAGTGAPFNLGEATVTRAAVRLASGETGVCYVLGRDRERARLAAFVDALWTTPDWRARVERDIVAPLATMLAERDRADAAALALTLMDFETPLWLDPVLAAAEGVAEYLQFHSGTRLFVLSHSDNIQATGFVEHLKLPHYVDFRSELGLLRRLRAEWAEAASPVRPNRAEPAIISPISTNRPSA